MFNLILTAMLSFGTHQSDTYSTPSGKQLSFVFFGHASFAVVCDEHVIYIDPVGTEADFSKLPKADVVLVTHGHGDHLDKAAVELLSTPATVVVSTAAVGEELSGVKVLRNGESTDVGDWVNVEAVAAYNTSPGRDKFHPAGRDNGYIITLDGERIYVSGDSEPTPEMARVKDIDYLFLAVNQPYTMTPEQAASVVNEMRPRVFYPYHFGQVDEPTNLRRLARLIESGATKMKVREME